MICESATSRLTTRSSFGSKLDPHRLRAKVPLREVTPSDAYCEWRTTCEFHD
jgi:hypothetical protein